MWCAVVRLRVRWCACRVRRFPNLSVGVARAARVREGQLVKVGAARRDAARRRDYRRARAVVRVRVRAGRQQARQVAVRRGRRRRRLRDAGVETRDAAVSQRDAGVVIVK